MGFLDPQAAGGRHPPALPSRRALVRRAPLMVWARSRFALPDRARRDPKDKGRSWIDGLAVAPASRAERR
jgi:hypothetical protein